MRGSPFFKQFLPVLVRFLLSARGGYYSVTNKLNQYQVNNSYFVLASFVAGHTVTLWQTELWPLSITLPAVFACVFAQLYCRAALCLLGFTLGLLSATLRFQAQLDSGFPTQWQRQDIPVTAKIVSLPKQRGSDISFRAIVLAQTKSPDLAAMVGQRLQLSCYRCPFDIAPGEIWRFTVRLKQPHGYASPGAFDYEKHLFRHRLVAKGYLRLKSDNQRLSSAGLNINAWRLNINRGITMALAQSSPDTHVGISTISALAVGDKSGFTQSQRQVLQASGLSHLFAISGLHIGLIFTVTLLLSRGLLNRFAMLFERYPRPYLCLLPAMTCATLYAALAGFSVSTQRALVMLAVFVICRLWTLEASLLKVLLIAASLLLLYDPFSILDPGFWLSCSAVLIIHMATVRNDKIGLFTLQPALWLGMLPLTVLFFGQLSWVSPLLNLIAVPLFCAILIPLTLLAVVLNELGASVFAEPILGALNTFYIGLFSLLDWVVAQPAAKTPVSGFVWWHGVLFVALAVAYCARRWWLHLVWPLLLASLAIPGFAASALATTQGDRLKLTLLDVGQGLAIVIQTGEAVTVYDTGPRYSSGFSAAQAVLLPYLRHEGIQRIDRLIVSHADNDHIGGYQTLVDALPVRELVSSRVDKLPAARECLAGQYWREGATSFSMVSPQAETPKGSNNRSCVLRLEHGGVSVLITGDIEKQVERFLVDTKAHLQADILLIPHQGSKTSSTASFLDAVQPTLALVAAGYLNHYGHPHEDVTRRYAERDIEIVSTIDSGSVEIDISEFGYFVRPYRQLESRFWHWRADSPRPALETPR